MCRVIALLWLALAAVPMCWSGGAIAADQFALWFDAEGNSQCQSGTPFVPVTLYIVLVEPTFEELYGWEAAVRSAEGEIFVMNASVLAGGLNSGSGADLRVQYAEPLAVGSRTVLATVQILPATPESCLILTGTGSPSLPVAGPIVWPSVNHPTEIATADIMASGVDAILGQCNSGPGTGIVSCVGVVSAVGQSWGSLKSMYR